jgi:hypothetical protein
MATGLVAGFVSASAAVKIYDVGILAVGVYVCVCAAHARACEPCICLSACLPAQLRSFYV